MSKLTASIPDICEWNQLQAIIIIYLYSTCTGNFIPFWLQT